MVVRKQATLPKKYIYNAAFLAVFVVAGAFAFRSNFETERVVGCVERAAISAHLPVTQSDGRPSLVDLRARTGGVEWGLDDNLTLTRSKDGKGAVLTVSFNGDEKPMFKGQRRRLDIESRTSGVGFDWDADVLDGRKVGCLTYAVQVPKTFPQNGAGILPGLVVKEDPSGPNDNASGHTLAFPMRWNPNGRLGMRIQRSNGAPGREYNIDVGAASLIPGHWHKIEQEITINTPGKPDGQVRIWINGTLMIDRRGLQFFPSALPLKFERVEAHVHFVDRNAIWQPAPQAANLSLRDMTLHGF